jgi:hypothetical protein
MRADVSLAQGGRRRPTASSPHWNIGTPKRPQQPNLTYLITYLPATRVRNIVSHLNFLRPRHSHLPPAPPLPSRLIDRHGPSCRPPKMSFDTSPIPPYNASDPHARFLSASSLDLLLIELVPLSQRLATEFSSSALPSQKDQQAPSHSSHPIPPNQGSTAIGADDDDEQREAIFYRLEGLGYRVGIGLVERFSRDRPRFSDPLDVIKFLCKDLWTIVWRKQVDNLKTNHRVGHVLLYWPWHGRGGVGMEDGRTTG